MVLYMVTRNLERMGYKVLPAKDPDEAINLAKTSREKIHLLLTDVIMPGMYGNDLVRNIRLFLPDLKCLYMSAYPQDVIARHGVLDDEKHFLSKPFTSKELANKVREMLNEV